MQARDLMTTDAATVSPATPAGARELMRSAAITVSESAYDSQIASVLSNAGMKRVPVMRAMGGPLGLVSGQTCPCAGKALGADRHSSE